MKELDTIINEVMDLDEITDLTADIIAQYVYLRTKLLNKPTVRISVPKGVAATSPLPTGETIEYVEPKVENREATKEDKENYPTAIKPDLSWVHGVHKDPSNEIQILMEKKGEIETTIENLQKTIKNGGEEPYEKPSEAWNEILSGVRAEYEGQ